MARIAKTDIEKRWYATFSACPKDDREIALRVLATLHDHLPEPRRETAKTDAPAPRDIFHGETE